MELLIKRIDQTLPLPEYQTAGSVAFDLYARVETVIDPHSIALIPVNLIIKVPDDYVILIASRSSTPLKKGLMCANGIGIIDQDFCGDDDEIRYAAYNFTTEPVTVPRGDRIGQALLVKIAKPALIETDQISAASRGGFGSTG
ncbi:TPA: dUTP diphosphatase [Candidatus Falkowbacteria bacterium]|nr:dUTP diphosphatase [Candidatus Falkowbacteria bacterium]